MNKQSHFAEAPIKLTKYMVQMNPQLSQATARRIIEPLMELSQDERDRQAEKMLTLLQNNKSEQEIIEALEQYG